jgi:hypothetical protein
MINLLTKIAISGLVVAALGVLGYGIGELVIWDWLTSIFTIFRVLLDPLSFIFDTNTLIIIIGKMFSIMVVVWAFYGYLYIARLFNSKS